MNTNGINKYLLFRETTENYWRLLKVVKDDKFKAPWFTGLGTLSNLEGYYKNPTEQEIENCLRDEGMWRLKNKEKNNGNE